MEYRRLGDSGLVVPALSFGAGTFGGKGALFSAWGDTDAAEARRLIDISLDAGVTMFDTADVSSDGASEEVLGQAVKGRRDQVIISTKAGLPTGDGPQDAGTSRSRLIKATEDALRRLGTDYIDLFQLHAFDARLVGAERYGLRHPGPQRRELIRAVVDPAQVAVEPAQALADEVHRRAGVRLVRVGVRPRSDQPLDWGGELVEEAEHRAPIGSAQPPTARTAAVMSSGFSITEPCFQYASRRWCSSQVPMKEGVSSIRLTHSARQPNPTTSGSGGRAL